MSPLPELRELVAIIRKELTSSGDAETLADGGIQGLDTEHEERIYAIVEQHGGRVRQQTIVEETEWSPSKVSRDLTRMESKGCIGRMTTGREKIVVLPECIPGHLDGE